MPLTLFRSSNNIPRSVQENDCSPVYTLAWATKGNLDANSRHNECRSLVAEWLARLTTMREVSHSNPTGNTIRRWAGVVPEMNLREHRSTLHMPLPNANKAAQSGFETQRRCHQKSKTGYQWPHKRTCVNKEFILKNCRHNAT